MTLKAKVRLYLRNRWLVHGTHLGMHLVFWGGLGSLAAMSLKANVQLYLRRRWLVQGTPPKQADTFLAGIRGMEPRRLGLSRGGKSAYDERCSRLTGIMDWSYIG
jgi:hypothetical protein